MATPATRSICVVTATRAEYGLLYWLLRELEVEPSVALQIVVTGAHLSPMFGMTVLEIEADGFPLAALVPIPVEDDSPLGITKSLAAATAGFGEAFARLAPDIVVLLGDRYETLAAAQAAMVARVPIAHIHGGEKTEGLIDEAIRHAITKMAHLHFVAAQDFRDRVVQLGEAPDRVWVVGATGLDNIERLTLLDRSVLEAALGVSLASPSFLVTYHPVTLRDLDQSEAFRTVVETLDEWKATIVITGVNADAGGSAIRRAADRFAADRADRVRTVESLGVLRYLSVMKHVDAVVGNSSSGLLEAPAMGVPTIDIGERQQGRLRAKSVIHADGTAADIRRAVAVALSPGHRAIAARRQTPYGQPGAAHRIVEVLRAYPLDGIVLKCFHDLPRERT